MIKKHKKENKKTSYLLMILFLLVIFGGLGLLVIRKQKDISDTENRTLNKIDFKTIKGFTKGEFQQNLSDALPDQIILSETAKKYGNKINLYTTKLSIDLLYDKDKYGVVPAPNGMYKIADSDYIVYGSFGLESTINAAKKRLDEINTISRKYNDINVYTFTITTDTNFKDIKEYDNYVHEYLDDKVKYSSFSKITSYDEYKKYFYKSDHHWNYNGQYEGYKEIATLLGFDDYIKINKLNCFDSYYIGSKARLIGDLNIKDQFCVYDYDLPKYIATINGSLFDVESRRAPYYNNQLEKNSVYHYVNFYAPDVGEMVYDFNANDKENILIFVDSFSNPINELIASHYNKSYIIDLRHYKELKQKDFILDEYLQGKDIKNILILGNINLFRMDAFSINVEGQ